MFYRLILYGVYHGLYAVTEQINITLFSFLGVFIVCNGDGTRPCLKLD
jgi:hypothetical protein